MKSKITFGMQSRVDDMVNKYINASNFTLTDLIQFIYSSLLTQQYFSKNLYVLISKTLDFILVVYRLYNQSLYIFIISKLKNLRSNFYIHYKNDKFIYL